jgi:TetR/AcrR family transcriptional regulator, transcriptional repressor for nem operon
MARPKEFDRDKALERALSIFWDKGYEATSTDDLLKAMGIGRQSMYDTFGDKHRLFIEALERYNATSSAALAERLTAGGSPIRAVESALLAIAEESPKARARGCMGVNATAELCQSDPDVDAAIKSSTRYCEAVFERVVREAKKRGEIAAAVDENAAASFLLATLRGLRVTAKSGAPPETLRDIATFALRSLTAR